MRLLRTQLHNSSGRVETGYIPSIRRTLLFRRSLPEVCASRALSTAASTYLQASSSARSQYRRCITVHPSRQFSDRNQARHQSTANAAEQSISEDDIEVGEHDEEPSGVLDARNPTTVEAEGLTFEDAVKEEEHVELPYTGLFDEQIPTEAGKTALNNAPHVNHQELFNLGPFCESTRKLLAGPGRVVRFTDAPVWCAVLPVLAERWGLHYMVIDEGHPYHGVVSEHRTPYLLVRSTDQLPIPEPTSQPLEDVLLDLISPHHIRDQLLEFRQLSHSPTPPQLMKLLMIACRYTPSALPILEFTQNKNPTINETTRSQPWEPTYRFRLSNEKYGISITKDVKTTRKSLSRSVPDAFMDYISTISDMISSSRGESSIITIMKDPAQFLGRALKALDWGTFSFVDTPVYNSAPLIKLDLWETQIQTTKHGPLGNAVLWRNQKDAHQMAMSHVLPLLKDHLQAAYKSGRLTPVEYEEFARYWGEQVTAVQPGKHTQRPILHEIQVNEQIVTTMVETLRHLMKTGFQSTCEWTSSKSAGLELDSVGRSRSLRHDPQLDESLYREYWRRAPLATNTPRDLPVREDGISSEIIRTIEASNITIITAATGSGKTTQIPQMIFDEFITAINGSMCNIVCTQPRRVSTISVATRVAFERHQSIGQEVGYKVRFDVRPAYPNCGITYMTSGYLLRLLETDPLEVLQHHSHIILDEVHTRDIDTDLLLTALKNVFDKRVLVQVPKMPKIILMSATINAGFFKSYFESLESQVKISTIDVPGRMYDVEERKLDHVLTELQESHPHELDVLLRNPELRNYVDEQLHTTSSNEGETQNHESTAEVQEYVKSDDIPAGNRDLHVPTPLLHLLIARLLSTTASGDILVFLPGLAEIEALEQLLLLNPLTQSEFSNPERYQLFKLHSALYETNYDVFEPVPSGCRRVILATNIAETSITLPDVKFVVDTGLSRQATFDQVTQSGTFGLQWISHAEIKQRRGRAGRTHEGLYYGTYSQARYDTLAAAPTPEILKMSLDQLVIRSASSKAFRLIDNVTSEEGSSDEVPAGQALLTTPSPPERRFVAAAAKQLHNIRALTAEGNATPMGKILSRLPMTPAAGKAVLLGLVFRCLDTLMLYGALREDLPIMFDPSAVSAVVDRRRMLAGPNDDDKWADSQAFLLYDGLRQQKDNRAAIELKETLSLRHDAYCEYAQISKQTFEKLEPLLGLPEENQSPESETRKYGPLFPTTPRELNTNSSNADLVKALAFSTLGTRFAVWDFKHWKTQNHPRVLPHPKSVNHGGTKRAVLAQRLRREKGDLLSYGAMRVILKDKYPWLHETATATPLIGILFAESVSFIEEESTFMINGWLTYRLYSEAEGMVKKRTAKIIWEYRKALDRFLVQAMQMISVEPHKLKKVRDGDLSVDDFNLFLGTKENIFREAIVDSVVKILGIDAQDRADRTNARTIEAQGGEEVSTVDANKTVQEPSNEPNPKPIRRRVRTPRSSRDPGPEPEPEKDNEEEVDQVFKMVAQFKNKQLYSAIRKTKEEKEDKLEKHIQSIARRIMSTDIHSEKRFADDRRGTIKNHGDGWEV